VSGPNTGRIIKGGVQMKQYLPVEVRPFRDEAEDR
jgi:hypothetical protein